MNLISIIVMLDLFLFFSILHFVKISWKVKILVRILHLLGCLNILNVRLFQLSPFPNLMPSSTVSINGNYAKTSNQVNNCSYPNLKQGFKHGWSVMNLFSCLIFDGPTFWQGRSHAGYYSFSFYPRILSCSSAVLLTAYRIDGISFQWREEEKPSPHGTNGLSSLQS